MITVVPVDNLYAVKEIDFPNGDVFFCVERIVAASLGSYRDGECGGQYVYATHEYPTTELADNEKLVFVGTHEECVDEVKLKEEVRIQEAKKK